VSKIPRIAGVMIGILAGTIVAISFRGGAKPSLVAPDETDGVVQRAPDPGNRSTLRQLVEGAKKEENWLKEYELTERSGRTISSRDLHGEPYVACFFFSTCPGTCTRQSNKMQLLQNKFKGKPIKFVSISVDPEIDTPEVLAEYAERFGADQNQWLFFTGSMDYIIRVGTEKFFLVNAEGDVVGAYSWQDIEEFEQLLNHIHEVLSIPSRTP
jgi:protein SCO1